jgi:glutamine amidotransferase
MITIIDYGLGNILAFHSMYRRLNIPVAVARSAKDLQGATRLILPGVGSFDHAMELLEASGMRQWLDELVLERRLPVLGVCVGMQILARSSEEGKLAGLGWIDGAVRKMHADRPDMTMRLPHMGWNDVAPLGDSTLFTGLERDARFYFLHSYYFECERRESVLAEADYGGVFACAVHSRNIHGVQFHPEKSHQWGTRLLKNFAEV